jgi:hypothetical protein
MRRRAAGILGTYPETVRKVDFHLNGGVVGRFSDRF